MSLLPRRSLSILSSGLLLLAITAFAYGYWDMLQDDSYIYYTYAKNLANGDGYVFNLTEQINATTSPLYTLLLALLYGLFGFLSFASLPILGRFIGLLSLLLLCCCLRSCFDDLRESLLPYILPLVLLASPLLSGALGMELFLAMALAVASLAVYVRGRFKSASLLGSLAVLARPDMLILCGLMLIHYLLRHRRLPRLAPAVLFVTPIFSWLAFSWFYFGSLVPSTLSAKLAQTETGLWGSGPVYLQALFSAGNWYGSLVDREQVLPLVSILFMTAVGLLVGAIISMARFRSWRLMQHPALQILVAWSVLHFIAYGVVLRAPAYSWYFTPLAIGMAVVVTLPLEAGYQMSARASGAGQKVTAGALLTLVAIVAMWLPLSSVGKQSTCEHDIHREAASWLNDHAPSGSSVGAVDSDILGYYYDNGPVIDGLGLVTPSVIEHVRRRDFSWYILEYKPDYLMLPARPVSAVDSVVSEAWFPTRYRLQVRIGPPVQAVAIYEKVRP